MGVHPDFPSSPYEVISPEVRWCPDGGGNKAEMLPPLVHEIRRAVHEWRDGGYVGGSATSQLLLDYWFSEPHMISNADGELHQFQYFFAQREAVETAIWLYEVQRAFTPLHLMQYDATGNLSQKMFLGDWPRYVFKLATGTGKTKVLSLLMAWSYFHKKYEKDSTLSTNFLLVAPNIIVLDRLLDDFGDLKIFREDPIVPENGYGGFSWREDFHLSLYRQDDVTLVSEEGNLFVTNIHRVYEKEKVGKDSEDATEYFLGKKPVTKTTKNNLGLVDIVHGVNDLVVLNDEAHHIHRDDMGWFKAIESINNKMMQRTGKGLSAQFDVTATPKHETGAVFAQTVCSYPLVEAIKQGVVKTPVVPDEASRAKLIEKPSDRVEERYGDHIKLGYLEWAKSRNIIERMGRKPILFIMTKTTKESDEVAAHVESTYPELTGKVLVIHTKANGEISETSNKELDRLRKASREIDSPESPYLCVVSVLMLREGWDVQGVTSMVGLRPYSTDSKVLPEQTLGRGLRRMFRNSPNFTEFVSVSGTPAFLEFVESVRSEGVELEKIPMGERAAPKVPLLIEVDLDEEGKDTAHLDIPLPQLTSRVTTQMSRVDELNIESMPSADLQIKEGNGETSRVILFRGIDEDETLWRTDLGQSVPLTQQAIISFLCNTIATEMKMVSHKDVLYDKIKLYVNTKLFTGAPDFDDQVVLKNLAEPHVVEHLIKTFTRSISELVRVETGSPEVISYMSFAKSRPYIANPQNFVTSSKTLFNKIVGDSRLELRFASFLDRAPDVEAFIKNTQFSIEYVKANGTFARYIPDFLVRTSKSQVYIIETKGLEDIDVAPKWNRLVQWCKDATVTESGNKVYTPLFVPQKDFDRNENTVPTMEKMAEVMKNNRPTMVKL